MHVVSKTELGTLLTVQVLPLREESLGVPQVWGKDPDDMG